MKRCFCLLLLSIFICGIMPRFGQARFAFSRSVVGYVKDREDHPVAGARVCANPMGGMGERIVCEVSKKDGSFTLGPLRPRIYTISAEDKTEGYPDAYNAFYGSFFGEMPVVAVDEGKEPEPVEVIVGPKAGRVVFRLVDDQSGKRIEHGSLKVCRTDRPAGSAPLAMCWWISTDFPHGEYEMLTPEVPFTIEFETPGKGHKSEKRTAFEEGAGPLKVLQVDLGVRKEMTVRLRRVHKVKE
jgi:hypothetical protein